MKFRYVRQRGQATPLAFSLDISCTTIDQSNDIANTLDRWCTKGTRAVIHRTVHTDVDKQQVDKFLRTLREHGKSGISSVYDHLADNTG